MNLIILRHDEVDSTGTAVLADHRATHITSVLKCVVGQRIRVGILNGSKGIAAVVRMDPGEVVLHLDNLDVVPPIPRIDVLLALPRPKVLRRLWAVLASLGVHRIVLTNAEKVERNYFDTHWLRAENYEPLLIEGLEQAGDTRLPRVSVVRRLKPFLEDDLNRLFPDCVRLLAHPEEKNLTPLPTVASRLVLLAIGPEGGWTDFELDLFDRVGFQRFSLGARPLRADVACIALISVVRSAGLQE